jgi:hypothetical protein
MAFFEYRSLQCILIPNAIKKIKDFTFSSCSRLTTDNCDSQQWAGGKCGILSEGLKKIGEKLFKECTLLQCFNIHTIHHQRNRPQHIQRLLKFNECGILLKN